MSEKSKPRVVLVGTGFGGVGLLHNLYNETKKNGEQDELPFDVTVMDRKTHMSIGASWQYVWTGRLAEAPQWPLQSLRYLTFADSARVGQGAASTVTSLSPHDQSLTLGDGTVLKYDTLVLAPGVVNDASPIDGLLASNAIDICDFNSVATMKERVQTLAASKEPQTVLVCVTKIPYKV